MLIEFQVGNFLSFKDVVTFSMVASDIDSQDEELDNNNIFSVNEELKLLKTNAVYGANGSGKSNLAKAIGFMKYLVINSAKMQITDPILVEPFKLNTETENKPSFFQIVFYFYDRIYRYGFEVSSKAVVKEWLYHSIGEKEYRLFERQNQKFIFISKKSFKEGEKLKEQTKVNSLFLSVCSQFNGKISRFIVIWFSNLLVISGLGIYDRLHRQNALEILDDPLFRDSSLKLIQNFDFSIEQFIINKDKIDSDILPSDLPEEFKSLLLKSTKKSELITFHKKYNTNNEVVGMVDFNLEENESEGTKKMFYFIPIFLKALLYGQILVIDELDTRLHPWITHKLVQLFNSNEHNHQNSQLIFMTHDTNLLNRKLFGGQLLRRDQIWFTEKNNQGATDLYSLAEYDISEDAPFESDYIKGRYGAIPFIGNFQRLLKNK
ncbi:AAA family ATPase [Geminocystis herdmanii]|uniref:AAA family ATPase n=1 Tax=Geminocystis herdmanii TaxID=669359 RepID=UPI000373E249|nr:ATP-binding protein [Geminocystis herdmanii]